VTAATLFMRGEGISRFSWERAMPATGYPVGAGHARDHLRNKAQCLPGKRLEFLVQH